MGNPYSSLKIFHHKDALDALAGREQRAPIYIRLKPTNFCNHHCAYCTYGSGDTYQKTENRDSIEHRDMIPWDKLQEIIADVGAMGVKALTFSGGGEPLTYPHIIEAVQQIKDYGIDLSLITNGQLLKGKIAESFYAAKWVRISFDAPVASVYSSLRRIPEASFHKVCANIRSFAQNKDRDCVLGVNFVISKANCDYVYEAAALLKELGVDNVKFAAVVENEPHYHMGIKDKVIEQLHRVEKELAVSVGAKEKEFRIVNNYENDWMDKNFTTQPFDKCYTCRLITIIAADQRVYLCHTRAYDSQAVVGDLHNQSFRVMWFSDATKKRLEELQPKRDCRNFCVYEERNRLIQSYFDTDMRHVNFI